MRLPCARTTRFISLMKSTNTSAVEPNSVVVRVLHEFRAALLGRLGRFVKRAQELGFSLDQVEELLQLAGSGPRSCDAARALAEVRVADLEAKIDDLVRMRDSLRRLVGTCARPRPDRDCPLLEAISTDTDPVAACPGRRR
jgi:hypothetical protein